MIRCLVYHYFRDVRNITISLPEELAHRAKVFAAENNTSVSRYVGALLAEKLESDTGYREAMKRWRSRKATCLNSSGRRYPSRDQLLYSEDLSHGQVFGNVRIVNPFLELKCTSTLPRRA
jgi:hypothetical protein